MCKCMSVCMCEREYIEACLDVCHELTHIYEWYVSWLESRTHIYEERTNSYMNESRTHTHAATIVTSDMNESWIRTHAVTNFYMNESRTHEHTEIVDTEAWLDAYHKHISTNESQTHIYERVTNSYTRRLWTWRRGLICVTNVYVWMIHEPSHTHRLWTRRRGLMCVT